MEEQSVSKINSNTYVPIGVIATLLSVLAGGIIWLTNVHAQVQNNTKSAEQQEKELSDLEVKIESVDTKQNQLMLLMTKQQEQIEYIKEAVKEIKRKVENNKN